MLTMESWPVDRLVEYARNPRKNEGVVDKMVSAIKEFGFRIPIVAQSDGVIVDGHLRLKAARKLGLAEVPVVLADDLSEAQIKAFRLLANRSVSWAEWDEELLALELSELAALDFDLGLTGFDPQEITSLTLDRTAVGNTDPDEAPGIPKHPLSKSGDLWVMGPLGHRLVCGDCTDPATVERVLAGIHPNLMVTDPPYGVQYDANWRNQVVRKNGTYVGEKFGGRAVGKVRNDDRADWREAWALFPGNVAYVWHSGIKSAQVTESLAAARFTVRSQIVWVKTRFVISRGNYHPQHEPAYYATREADDAWQNRYVPEHETAAYAVRDGKTADWRGGRKQSTVWFVEHLKSETGHSTQKPVEVMRRPIENNSSVGQAVYEPFSGSGTTIIAGEMTGRTVLACELEPAYVDVAVSRWCKFTGKKAVRNDGFEWDGSLNETGPA